MNPTKHVEIPKEDEKKIREIIFSVYEALKE